MTLERGRAVVSIESQELDSTATNRATSQGLFVINLRTLTAPITVPQPRASSLTRYSFFLSRCSIDGQRKYQLHMGYFANAAEAHKWLATLKKVYPQAHVSEAPEAQPDLMSDTQQLRILNLGQVDTDAAGSTAPPRQRPTADLPSSRELFVRDTGSARVAKNKPSLEDTLNELRTSEFDMGSEDDDLNATGVRHLRIDRLREAAAARSAQKPGPRVRK